MRFQNLIHQPLLKYKFKQLIDIISPLAQLVEGLPHNLKVQGLNPYSSLQIDDRLNIDREFWSQVIYKAYTCERRLSPKSSTKHRLQFLFFHVDLFLSHVQGVHPANILQASRKDVASIHTSLASCEHYDWSACLQRAYCMRVSFQKYAFANTLRALMYASNTHAARLRLACCVLAARRLRAFFLLAACSPFS